MEANVNHPLLKAIELVGLSNLARHLGVSGQAIRKWERAGRLPRTEWSGETQHAKKIQAVTQSAVMTTDLLAPWPASVRDNDGATKKSEAA